MKLISIDMGRATWLFPTEEFLPLGGSDGEAIISEVSSRYSFRHPPANPTREDIDKNGLRFSGGNFAGPSGLTNLAEFVVYNDGIAATASSTEGAEAFLEDISKFLIEMFNFRGITSEVKKIDLSGVVVEFNPSLTAILGARDKIATIIGNNLNAIERTNFPVELTRIELALNKDPEFRPHNVPKFLLEKRANTPFEQHRYYSQAPVSTSTHLQILTMIEQELIAPH
jgi:hypothetical protein